MSISFEYLKVKRDKSFKNFTDEELVKISQKDIDKYRKNCNWSCSFCKREFSYKKSLKVTNENYIHEIRAGNLIFDCDHYDSCKKKMTIKHKNNVSFSSKAFSELFARYQGWIVHESEKARAIDSPEEIYCELCGAFSKIVGMFARNGEFAKVSEKWFSSFFFKSIQNKISDIQKTKSYQKRSPMIKCEVCDNYVGKITSKHLLSDGHEDFIKKLYIDIGKQILEDSGEIIYYDNDIDIENRAMVAGAISLARKEKREASKFLKLRSLSLYFNMYTNSKTRNSLLSTNMPIDEEENNTIEDTVCESVTVKKGNDAVESIYVKETVEILVDTLYDNNYKNSLIIDKMFKEELIISNNKKKAIMREIIFDKMSHLNLKNSELDKSYDKYIENGFTSRLLRMIRNDNSCRILLVDSRS